MAFWFGFPGSEKVFYREHKARWAKVQEGREGLAINNTFLTRFLTLVALHTTAKFHKLYGLCRLLSDKIIIKTGFSVHLSEAVTMKCVAEHTSIPVPKRIQSEDLESAMKKLSKSAREKIFLQLKNMVSQLKALEPPPGIGVKSCNGGSMYDPRLPHGKSRSGSFSTMQDFHRWLRQDLEPSQIGPHVSAQEVDDLKAIIQKQDGDRPPPVFTHCYLSPFNIMVRGEEIVGLIDWEISGWYPAYWEYTCAYFGNLTRTRWQDTLCSLLEPFPEELEMEKVHKNGGVRLGSRTLSVILTTSHHAT
ncbi:hypothetical protein BS50DRAFT_608843 [Corynespora cassiicola Philippines]|uniref:Aminoglycoside phosphotransferase domain-containing protein n=1 Tax=Corynespora cassiicola Philippines TaxID=1448308 RepID=A0A2T2NYX5_CORCC|nr:hypothetical protein BS50DRAFT_608843 [Corynespora cassiicola Philippines]